MKYVFNFPDLGEGLEEGTILEWYVKEGDRVKVGDLVVQMETDKVVADIPSPKSGIITACYGAAGDVIPVGSPLVDIELEGVENEQGSVKVEQPYQTITEQEDVAAVVGTMELADKNIIQAPSDEGSLEIVNHKSGSRKVLATPATRAMAKKMNIDISNIKGSGPLGRVMDKDIVSFKESREQKADRKEQLNGIPDDVTYQPLTQIRKTIARNMLKSKQNAAHMSIFEEVEISGLIQLKDKLMHKLADKGVKLTYLPFIVKAVALALKQHSQLNSQIDFENNRMIISNRYNIAIAVDAPDGLVVPVIRDADKLSIFQIAMRTGELATKARSRKLTLDDLKGGSFSITSFGSIGGIFATPALNYLQAGILGIGRILKTPIVKNNEIVIGNIMPLSLTVDHRIVDGGETARFIRKVMEFLSEPVSLLLDL
ncbi:dihydrolipoamide acetyltransferase family protein [Proteiniphilum sp. UBA5280]|uniref:dihydrolipoamide acetyltransferase family protein n=1 Tax=Proteiniphilum sp. UBA5280 TaxID=1947273 RepID=UPI00257CE9DF|nr:dihydrolipoamide acetyltransferase family protein [Proteiniphilum sp. UBA5280]